MKAQTFKKVEALIYLFDVTSASFEQDIQEFRSVLERLHEFSPDAQLFVLIHKMDVYEPEERAFHFSQMEGKVKLVSRPFRLACFPTSIYDDTLYAAWSAITYSLIPMISQVEARLNAFCSFIEADEVVVYEASSLLVISYSSRQEFNESRRFENISTSIKSFAHSCTNLKQTRFQAIHVELPNKKVYFDNFTSSTYIMVIFSAPHLTFTNIALNVNAVRGNFEALIGFKGDEESD